MNIQYNTAKLAKEKGFDIPIWSFYGYDKKLRTFNQICNFNGFKYGVNKASISSPIQSELQTWLREVHKIQIEIEADWNQEMTEIIGYYYFNYKTWSEKVEIVFKEMEHFDTYEQALEVALLESLKLI